MKKIIRFFDKLEDKVRRRLSHFPIFYAIIGGTGIIIFWRGIWHFADYLSIVYLVNKGNPASTIDLPSPIDGIISALIGLVMLLMTGLFVSSFIGNHIIISGLKGEKKLTEKTEAEVKEEESVIKKVHDEIHLLAQRLENIEKKLEDKNQKQS